MMHQTSKQAPSRSIFRATIDLDANGKHFGHIQIPHSRNEAGAGNLLIPMVSIKNGDGPCLLLVGGNHGDEFEGQIALRRVAHALEADSVRGQIIILPALSLPAVLGNCRMSPIDGQNMNRAFPGNRLGTITEQVASYVYDELVQRAAVVVDLHAGGRNYSLVCQARMHRYADPATSQATLELMNAFAAPLSIIADAKNDPDGTLTAAAKFLNKPSIYLELGGSGAVTPHSIAITIRGVQNLLVHCGITEGEVDAGDEPPRVMAVPSGGFVWAQDEGVFEPFVDLGDTVQAGQAVGQMHCIHLPDREPLVHKMEASGLVYSRRTTGRTEHGDFLMAVVTPTTPDFRS